MRLYSDTLTREDILEAAKAAGVYIWEWNEIKRARVRRQGWNIYLSGSSSYRSQATGEKAATWDEHGIFMAALYRKDPKLRIAFYRDLRHFMEWTLNVRDSAYNRSQPESKRVRAPWLSDFLLQRKAGLR